VAQHRRDSREDGLARHELLGFMSREIVMSFAESWARSWVCLRRPLTSSRCVVRGELLFARSRPSPLIASSCASSCVCPRRPSRVVASPCEELRLPASALTTHRFVVRELLRCPRRPHDSSLRRARGRALSL